MFANVADYRSNLANLPNGTAQMVYTTTKHKNAIGV